MKLVNPLPFPGFIFQQYNNRAELMAVVALSATYEIAPADGALTLTDPQPPIRYTDAYDDKGHLIFPADFVPYRPATDVTALGWAYPPTGKPEKSWFVGIKIADKGKVLRVHGPRFWQPQEDGGWTMGEAEPASSVPLSYVSAFGGPIPQAEDDEGPADCHRFNPIGPGLLHETLSPRDKPLPAPRIEADDAPIADWREDYQPQGFAPIAPVWRFRQQYAGTYDESWLETRHPFLPFDFDYRFYNCAHPDMIFSPYLKGGERVEIVNLHPDHKRIVLKLPTPSPTATAARENGTETHAGLNLDGVHFNLVAKPPTLRLTWRRAFMWQDGISRITLADTHGQGGETPPAVPEGEEAEAAS